MSQRIAGMLQVQINGTVQDATGNFTYNLGFPKRTPVPSTTGFPGFKEEPSVAFIEGNLIDRGTVDLKALVTLRNATVTLKLGNGKTISLDGAYYAGDGNATTDEAQMAVRFESGAQGEEITGV